MDKTLRELLRNNILIQLESAGERGITLPTICLGAKIAGIHVKEEEIADEVTYLQDKSCATPVAKTLSPENRRYRITADGRDYLAEQGLA